LGPMAGMLTITPLRWLIMALELIGYDTCYLQLHFYTVALHRGNTFLQNSWFPPIRLQAQKTIVQIFSCIKSQNFSWIMVIFVMICVLNISVPINILHKRGFGLYFRTGMYSGMSLPCLYWCRLC
jgi:hypothetical protein